MIDTSPMTHRPRGAPATGIGLLLTLAGCSTSPLQPPADGRAANRDLVADTDLRTLPDLPVSAADLTATLDARAGDGAAMCDEAKLRFTLDTGCLNDGSVEFCVPDNDAALVARVTAIAPAVTCAPGRGRARCTPGVELLCFFPTGPGQCLAYHGALTDAAWDALCALTLVPEIREIVPTWFE